ncbi:MAG: hypothetical protein ABIY55_09735 [Kofleriaceae bacterium]
MSAVVLLRFDESGKLQPSDALGNLADLGTEAGIVAPSRVTAWTGSGRRFLQAATTGLVAPDKSGNGTLLQRDVTIQALISLTLSAATGAQTIIARGLNDGTAAERYAYGLELQEQAGFPGFVEVRWFWQDETGAIKTQAPGVFRHPGDGVELMLTATRRWESTSRVVLRYYVADELIAELVSPDGNISGGTTGRLTIGARKTAGAYGRHLNGVIDELLVTDNELSLEEIRHTWKRLTEYQPGGVETFSSLTPPGSVWAKNLGNDIGKRVKIVGELLGLAVAGAEELRALLLPDAAPHELVERWENICELSASPGDSLDARRARVLSYLAREEGFQLAPIAQALSGTMDLDARDVQVDEFTNTITDDFSDSSISSSWLDGGGVTWSIAAGKLRALTAATADLRWESRSTPFLLMACEPGRLFVAGKIEEADYSVVDPGLLFGLVLHNRSTADWLWFGIRNSGGDPEIVYRTAIAGGSPGEIKLLASPTTFGPFWFRIATDQASSFVDDGAITLSYSAVGPLTGFVEFPINTGNRGGWGWAGFAVTATSASVAATALTFDDFVLHNADSLRPFIWYALRDLSAPGTPDMVGSDRLVQKVKPAYTHAAAITRRVVLCDDAADGLCDHGPLGGR